MIVGILGYSALLVALAWRGGWHIDGALLRLGEQQWLPFYYHYWTTEQKALESLVRNAVLYAPVGMAIWTWRFAGIGGHRTELPGGAMSFCLGAGLAVLMETTRLLKPDSHGDPTNILIAAVSAWFAFRLSGWSASCLLSDNSTARITPPRSFLRT